MKPKDGYTFEQYDGEGIFTCRGCNNGELSFLGIAVIKDYKYIGTYCKKCTKKLFCEPEPVSKPRSECLTYNDIINALSFIMEKAENEAISEVDHISILECEITNLISRLQSESPSQTPSP